MSDLLAQAEAIVKQALHVGADEAEVYLESGASVDVDLEADAISGANISRSQGGSVRVLRDGHLGFAYFTDIDRAPAAIQQALDLSKLAPRTAFRFSPGEPIQGLQNWDDGLAVLDAAPCLEWAKDALASSKDALPDATVAGGGAGLSFGESAIANSRGAAAWDRETEANVGLALALEEGDSALNAWDMDNLHRGAPDAAGVATRVATMMESLRGAKPAVSGEADLILLPDAASSLLDAGFLPAVDGDSASRGKSVWTEQLGEVVASEGLTIADDPLREGAIGGTAYDGEGLATARTPIIENGELKTFLFDSWDACRHGRHSTHHAVRGGFKSPPGTGAHYLAVEHKVQQDVDTLIAGIDKGYVAESLLGAHTANATTGEFSVTAPNVWRVEKGEIVHASEAVAIAGNLPEMLLRVDAIGDTAPRRSGGHVPAMRVRDVAFSA